MIFKVKRLSEIEMENETRLDDYVYINTKNIVSIETSIFREEDNSTFWGLEINGFFIPLYDTNHWTAFQAYDDKTRKKLYRIFDKADENTKEEMLSDAWDFASNKIDEILNQIIEAMNKEADNE